MPSASPAALIAESLSAFSKSALKSLSDLEKQLTQSATDARDAQKERDIAIKQAHASQRLLDSQAQDVHKYKSALMQAELTAASQADIIAQLQREAGHWKEQARNWQDHFTHVEEERCALSAKLDEILSSQPLSGQFVSTHLIGGISSPLSTAAIKRTSSAGYFSTASKLQSPVESPAPSHIPKAATAPRNRTAAQQTAKPATDPKPKPRKSNMQSKTRVVRRVQAVVQVKSEDEEQELDSASPIGDSKPKQPARKSMYIPEDDEASDDDEDELMLGGEDTRRVAQAASSQSSTPPPPIKKRKLNNSTRQKSSKKA